MYALATCSASVLRGTGTDDWGDVTDNATVAASGIPARIVVRNKTVFDPSTQTPRVVQVVVGAVGSEVDVVDTDQIRDDTRGVLYAVESVTQPNGPGITPDLALQLRRVK
jgi:hypothetical protein